MPKKSRPQVPKLTPAQKATILGDPGADDVAGLTPRQAKIRASNHLLVWLTEHSQTIGEANAMEIMNLANAILKGQRFTVTTIQP